jgi:hypothetical protein
VRRSALRQLALVPALLVCLLALSACGSGRFVPVDPSQPVKPSTFHRVHFAQAGLSIAVPRNWTITQAKAPLLSIFSSGNAIVAIWSFPRTAPAPSGAVALNEARQELIRLSRQREPSLQVIRSSVGVADGQPDVEVDAFQTINGHRRRVRSLHIFTGRAEVVLEQYAPPALFHEVDHFAFSPMKRSLRIQPSS